MCSVPVFEGAKRTRVLIGSPLKGAQDNGAMTGIYLDHNATTPLSPEVREAMEPFLGARYGNASCKHRLGQDARKAVDESRAVIAEFFGCANDEVVFTGGGTEANN